jgi:hypothetical protein
VAALGHQVFQVLVALIEVQRRLPVAALGGLFPAAPMTARVDYRMPCSAVRFFGPWLLPSEPGGTTGSRARHCRFLLPAYSHSSHRGVPVAIPGGAVFQFPAALKATCVDYWLPYSPARIFSSWPLPSQPGWLAGCCAQWPGFSVPRCPIGAKDHHKLLLRAVQHFSPPNGPGIPYVSVPWPPPFCVVAWVSVADAAGCGSWLWCPAPGRSY